MGRKTPAPGRTTKKSQRGKRAAIDKLIEKENRKKALSGTKLSPGIVNVRIPPPKLTSRDDPHKPSPSSRVQPRKVIPGLTQDQMLHSSASEHLYRSQEPLVLFPREPNTKRALRYTSQGHFPFLKLPGELRNRIYELTITRQHYEIGWVNNSRKTKTLTYRLPKLGKAYEPHLEADTARRRRQLDCCRRVPSQKQLAEGSVHAGPAALLAVCNKMHGEACSVFYSKSSFTFHGLGALRHFLNHLSSVAMESLTQLSIKYRAYGEPNRTEDQKWKAKHDQLWEDLCWRIADQCTALTRLSLDLTLNKSPLWFAPFDLADKAGIGARWIIPLWAFQDAGIQQCKVRLHCLSKDDSVLEVESWKVRKEILGASWDEEAEATRDAYGYQKMPRTKKAMVIRLRNDGQVEAVE